MTRFEEAVQCPTDMAICIAFCIAGYLDQSGIHDFSDNNELIQFMTEISIDIEKWLLNEESEAIDADSN